MCGLTVNTLSERAHENSVNKGWWEKPNEFGTSLMLITSELAEALEEFRMGHLPNEVYFKDDGNGQSKPEGIPIELADAVIRIADIAGYYGIDLEAMIELKMAFNTNRPYKHGGKLI